MPVQPETPPMGEAIEAVKDTYTRLARERAETGKEIPARPLYLTGDRDSDDWIKQSVESSQELVKRSRNRGFKISWLPGQYERIFRKGGKEHVA